MQSPETLSQTCWLWGSKGSNRSLLIGGCPRCPVVLSRWKREIKNATRPDSVKSLSGLCAHAKSSKKDKKGTPRSGPRRVTTLRSGSSTVRHNAFESLWSLPKFCRILPGSWNTCTAIRMSSLINFDQEVLSPWGLDNTCTAIRMSSLINLLARNFSHHEAWIDCGETPIQDDWLIRQETDDQ